MIDEKLLSLLACPACQGDVELKSDKMVRQAHHALNHAERSRSIVCTRCQRSYPIVDGIPVLLAE